MNQIRRISDPRREEVNATIIMPRESVDFEPEMSYLRSIGANEAAVRCIRWEDVKARLSMLRKTLPGMKCLYDLSSEADPLVLERLRDEGIAFSASGAAHLERLQVLSVPSSGVSLTAGAPLSDTIQAAQSIKPRTLSVGSLSALESLIQKGCAPSVDWQPILQIVVRSMDSQPLVNPVKLKPILDRAKNVGFSSFGVSIVVEQDLTTREEHHRLVDSVRRAAQSCAAEQVTVDVIQILGGLTDSQSLKRKAVALDSYLADLSQTIGGIKAAIQEVNPSSQAGVEVEVGQLLLGHFPTLGRIANVKTQRADGVREIFTFLSVYGDLAGHLYHKTPVYIQILPDPDSGGQLSSKLVEAVVHCGTCDSIDSVFQEDGKTLVSFFVPEDVKGGCLLVVFGKRLADGATDFNQIPPARVVLIDCYDDEQPYKWSVLSDFQAPQVIAAERFWASESSSQLRKHFERTIGQIDRHEKVGGLLLSELATNAKLRGERFVKAAQAYLESDFNASETVTLLDLDVYAATMRNVGRYLRESVPLEPGESIEDLKKRITPGRISGVDEIMLPIKTLCDPIALLCQAAAGFGHDAASAGEMWMSSQVGVESKKVIVSHPHKTPETLRMICDSRYAPWAVTIDSDQELDRLVEAGLSKDTVIFIRFKATGASVVSNLSAKFGHPVSSDEDRVKIIELLKRVRDEGFKDFGWAFHVGTQSSQKDDYHHALKVALKLTRMAQEADKGLVVRNFNIGGGVCDERVALKDRTSGKRVLAGIGAEVTAFRGAVEKIIEERAWIVAEPGRVTCAAAGFMMSQVIAGADSGISGAVLRWAPTVQGILSGNVHDMAYYNLMPVHPQPGTLDIPYQVFGSSNRGNDRFPSLDPSGAHMLPSNLRSGDWLMSPEAGVAYGWNASGPIDGIDPGRLVAYYIEEGGKIQFFESPWSRRAGLSNRILKECVVTRGTSAVPPM